MYKCIKYNQLNQACGQLVLRLQLQATSCFVVAVAGMEYLNFGGQKFEAQARHAYRMEYQECVGPQGKFNTPVLLPR
jgi:hypothetical protein